MSRWRTYLGLWPEALSLAILVGIIIWILALLAHGDTLVIHGPDTHEFYLDLTTKTNVSYVPECAVGDLRVVFPTGNLGDAGTSNRFGLPSPCVGGVSAVDVLNSLHSVGITSLTNFQVVASNTTLTADGLDTAVVDHVDFYVGDDGRFPVFSQVGSVTGAPFSITYSTTNNHEGDIQVASLQVGVDGAKAASRPVVVRVANAPPADPVVQAFVSTNGAGYVTFTNTDILAVSNIIDRSDDGGDFSNVAILAATTNEFHDSGLDETKPHSYRLTTKSVVSLLSTGMVAAAELQTNVTVASGFKWVVCTNRVVLSWTPSVASAGVKRYVFEEQLCGGCGGCFGFSFYLYPNIDFDPRYPIFSDNLLLGAGDCVSYTIATEDNVGNFTQPGQFSTNAPASMVIAVPTNGCTDILKPSCSISTPTNNSTASNSIPIVVVSTDDVRVASVQIGWDTTIITNFVPGPYSNLFNTASIAGNNATHSFWAKSTDLAGNMRAATNSVYISNGGGTLSPGTTLWAKGLIGPTINDTCYGFAFARDSSNNVFVTGQFAGTVDFGGQTLTSLGGWDIFVAKYTSSGSLISVKRIGGPLSNDVGYGIGADSAGNYYVTGIFDGTVDFGNGSNLTSAGFADVFVAKYSSAGSNMWARRFGNTGTDYGYSIALDSGNNLIIAGFYSGSVDFGGGPVTNVGASDGFLVKYSSAGSYLWAKTFGSNSTDAALSVAIDTGNNVIVAGKFWGLVNFGGTTLASAGRTDAFVAKYDSNGSHLWSQRFGNTRDDVANAVAVDSGGNVIVAGSFNDAVNFGGSTLGADTKSSAFLAKYSSSGVHQWSKAYDTTSLYVMGINSVASDANGNILFTGGILDYLDFGCGFLFADANGGGTYDIYMVKLSSDGNCAWSERAGAAYDDFGNACTFDNAGNALITGRFYVQADFKGTVLMNPNNKYSGFVVKFSP